jgi:hypothetical protein
MRLLVVNILVVSLCVCLIPTPISAINHVLSLDGDNWWIHNENRTVKVKGEVPGEVHLALLENGLISDPYYRFNDVEVCIWMCDVRCDVRCDVCDVCDVRDVRDVCDVCDVCDVR